MRLESREQWRRRESEEEKGKGGTPKRDDWCKSTMGLRVAGGSERQARLGIKENTRSRGILPDLISTSIPCT